jgi:adenine phosphoribosyltransferase
VTSESHDERRRHRSPQGQIRDAPDFPKPGIVFGTSPPSHDPEGLRRSGDLVADLVRGRKVSKVVAIERRDSSWAVSWPIASASASSPCASRASYPRALAASYALEYGTDSLEIHDDALQPGESVLIVDDVIATGGTARAAAELVEGWGAGGGVFSDRARVPERSGEARRLDVASVIHY